MFERFSEPARQVVVLAQHEARLLKHSFIGTEHLLLGLLREGEGLGARTLASLGVGLDEVRAQVARIVGQGEEATTGQIPFTPRAKKVLELSLREAVSLGHDSIGTEHILLGLVRESEGVAARILLDFDADAAKIRNEIFGMPSRGGELTGETALVAEAVGIPAELVDEIERARREKEEALAAQDFERAAAARDRERQLLTRAGVEPMPPSMPTPGERLVAARSTRLAAGVLLTPLAMLVGAALLGIGILIGWTIWG